MQLDVLYDHNCPLNLLLYGVVNFNNLRWPTHHILANMYSGVRFGLLTPFYGADATACAQRNRARI